MMTSDPKNLSEIVGQDFSQILKWIEKGRKKALLIYGPVGVGKTSSVYALAKEKDFELLELNSSHFRKKDQIKNIIGEASLQQSLFFKKRLLLIDEIDGISGRYDYGGLAEIGKVIDKTKNKIILTANDISNSKFKAIRRKCEIVEFKHVNYNEIFLLLKKICEEKNIKYEELILKNIARKNNGDVRASLLDFWCGVVDNEVSAESGFREYQEELEDNLRLIFKSKDVKILLNAFSNVPVDLGEIMLWIDENLSKEYSSKDLFRAYDCLSRAEVFSGRILRRQYYRLMVYQSSLLKVGVGLAKQEKKEGFVSYSRPGRILKMWIAKNRGAKRKSICEKFASLTHCSLKKTYKDFDFFVSFLNSARISKELELDDDEIKWLGGK